MPQHQHVGAEAKIPLWAGGRICWAITVRIGSQTLWTKPAFITWRAYFSPFECRTNKAWAGGEKKDFRARNETGKCPDRDQRQGREHQSWYYQHQSDSPQVLNLQLVKNARTKGCRNWKGWQRASRQAFEYSVIPVLSPLDSRIFFSRLAIRDVSNTQ